MQGDRALWCVRVRRLTRPPGSLRSPVPPKGRTTCSQSPFEGGRQRSAATMQGDQLAMSLGSRAHPSPSVAVHSA
jgi:hypothetical protein